MEHPVQTLSKPCPEPCPFDGQFLIVVCATIHRPVWCVPNPKSLQTWSKGLSNGRLQVSLMHH